MKNILITRSQFNPQAIPHDFTKDDYRFFFEPLFTIEKLPIEKISEKVSAVIITSANACFALEDSKIGKATKIFTVGAKTADRIKKIGFQNVVISPNNSAASLLDFLKKEPGQILYFRGSKISFDFAAKLKNLREIIAYKTHAVENFSADFKKIPYDEVIIFSKNSCEIFCDLISRHNLLEYFSRSQIICPSDEILKKARELGFEKSHFRKIFP